MHPVRVLSELVQWYVAVRIASGPRRVEKQARYVLPKLQDNRQSANRSAVGGPLRNLCTVVQDLLLSGVVASDLTYNQSRAFVT